MAGNPFIDNISNSSSTFFLPRWGGWKLAEEIDILPHQYVLVFKR
jgi:hypothetical protein